MGQRSLQNAALALLSYTNEDEIGPRALAQYNDANNMTNRVAALHVLANSEAEERGEAFGDFGAVASHWRFHYGMGPGTG